MYVCKQKNAAARRRFPAGTCGMLTAVQERSLGCARDDGAGEKTYFNIRGKPTPSRFARLTLSLVTGSGVLGSGTIHKMGIVYPFVEVAVEVTGDQETSDVRLPSFRIVIEIVAEGSLSFAVKRTMFGKLNRETCFPGNLRASPHTYSRRSRYQNPEP